MILKTLTYFSLLVTWVYLSVMCAVFARQLLNVPGNGIFDSPLAIAIGVAMSSVVVGLLVYLVHAGFRRRARHAPGPIYLCRSCGYDLRGVTDATACPECGAEITEARRTLLRVMRERGIDASAGTPKVRASRQPLAGKG